ncbi:hypothetical protein HID58_067771 [Brassica napus]|uniref:Uncharacterized protein n=1 Tax=Brassica napus TaxID=3708 RepID=A0ABQ7ZJJ6_BRANA|nr:hypothetical protein HID58_067771 [Brassica napus]
MKRLSFSSSLAFLPTTTSNALGYLHLDRIVHCYVKPEYMFWIRRGVYGLLILEWLGLKLRIQTIPRCCQTSLLSRMEKFWDANHEKLRQMQKVVKMLEGVDTSQGGRMIPEDQRPAVSSLSPIYIFTTLYPSYYHYYLSFYLAFLSNALY